MIGESEQSMENAILRTDVHNRGTKNRISQSPLQACIFEEGEKPACHCLKA